MRTGYTFVMKVLTLGLLAAGGAVAVHRVLRFRAVVLVAPMKVWSWERKFRSTASASLAAVVGKPDVRIVLGKDLKLVLEILVS